MPGHMIALGRQSDVEGVRRRYGSCRTTLSVCGSSSVIPCAPLTRNMTPVARWRRSMRWAAPMARLQRDDGEAKA